MRGQDYELGEQPLEGADLGIRSAKLVRVADPWDAVVRQRRGIVDKVADQ